MSEKIEILINEIVVPSSEIEGALNTVFSESINIENETSKSYSGSLIFRGSAYETILNEIICQPIQTLSRVNCKILDKCCKDENGNKIVLFDGVIEGANVTDWQPSKCTVKIEITDNSQVSQQIQCLKDHFIWDRQNVHDSGIVTDGEDTSRQAVYIPYCEIMNNRFAQWFILVNARAFTLGFAPILIAAALIVEVLNGIIMALNAALNGLTFGAFPDIPLIDFDGDASTNNVTTAVELLFDIENIVIGCGNKHKAPFIYSYLSNLCELCGLTLDSSLFNPGGDYYNSVRLDANIKSGKKDAADIENIYNENKPNLNGIQFLNSFRDHNIIWRIDGGRLVVEHESYTTPTTWFDVLEINPDDIISFKINPPDETPCAYAVYEYSQDGVDTPGDSVRSGWTRTTISFNSPPNPSLKGACQKTMLYGAAQFRKDRFREREQVPDNGLIETFFPQFGQWDHVLYMSKGTATLPKLLQYDGVSERESARIERMQIGDLFVYNFAWHIDNKILPYSTAWQNLLFSDNPRHTGIKTKKYELVLRYTCDLLRRKNLNSVITLYIKNEAKTANISGISVNPFSRTLTITGKL